MGYAKLSSLYLGRTATMAFGELNTRMERDGKSGRKDPGGFERGEEFGISRVDGGLAV
jgi:hypothetical protein